MRVHTDTDQIEVILPAVLDLHEHFKYIISYNPLKVEQWSSNILTQVVNPRPSLYVEDTTTVGMHSQVRTCFDGLRLRTLERTGEDVYNTDQITQSIALTTWLPYSNLFGVPERESSLELRTTTGGDPYRLFATDQPNHMPGNPQPLYGSIPYVTGFDEKSASAFLWVNSAQTMIDIDKDENDGSIITFTSESGALELFVFASTLNSTTSSTNRIKKVNYNLAVISGFAPMPMIQTLGYHFCKWANVSAEILM